MNSEETHRLSGPSGLKVISSWGSNVSDPTNATNIAKLVRSPKTIVGIKFESDRIENPATIVIEVKYIARPILL
tara:strand:+ start:671 stop:892 length:222 start_codon:yes stop_codon:yes gene_type:complete